MKTTFHSNPRTRMLAATLALGGLFLATQPAPPVFGIENPATTVVDHLRNWQEKMSNAFRDTFRNLRGIGEGKSLGSVSADLREQNDSYMLRLSLPDRTLDKVEVVLEGNSLRIVAPEEGKARRYEQTMALGDVPADAKLQIDRKQGDNLIVVTVPKASVATAKINPPSTNDSAEKPFFYSEQGIMQNMERMRREMDKIFEDSFRDFKLLPDYKGIFDESRFGSSYNVEELSDHYVVRAYLPDRDLNNVNVTVDGQTLRIEAKAEDTASKPNDDKRNVVHKAHYTQLLTLPGPVNSVKMKVDRKEGVVVITLPKADPKTS